MNCRTQKKSIHLGPLVNADDIAKQLIESGFVDLNDYQLKNIQQADWNQAITNLPEISSRIKLLGYIPSIQILENTLVYKTKKLDGYASALIADFLRYMMLEQEIDFSFETVMSHEGKLAFLEYARKEGYITYLYYIATESPIINIARVENRVKKGGHDVENEKIRSRYYRSLSLLWDALKIVNRAFIMDNSSSDKRNFVILEKKYNGNGEVFTGKPPQWFMQYVVNKMDR